MVQKYVSTFFESVNLWGDIFGIVGTLMIQIVIAGISEKYNCVHFGKLQLRLQTVSIVEHVICMLEITTWPILSCRETPHGISKIDV